MCFLSTNLTRVRAAFDILIWSCTLYTPSPDSATDERQLKAVMEFRKAYSAQSLEGSNIPKVTVVYPVFSCGSGVSIECFDQIIELFIGIGRECDERPLISWT